jgi:hypothetical protein
MSALRFGKMVLESQYVLTTHSSGRRSIACALTNVAVPAPLNSGVRDCA